VKTIPERYAHWKSARPDHDGGIDSSSAYSSGTSANQTDLIDSLVAMASAVMALDVASEDDA